MQTYEKKSCSGVTCPDESPSPEYDSEACLFRPATEGGAHERVRSTVEGDSAAFFHFRVARFNSVPGTALLSVALFLSGCASNTVSSISSTPPVSTPPPPPPTRHILFVGDSFTHGRYLPVRTYNNTPGTGGIGSIVASAQVVDENFNTTVQARMENQSGETGPWGGITGIFAELAQEAGLLYDVHIEAISETRLIDNYNAAKDVIDQSLWDAVVLQEASFQPIPVALSQNNNSNPSVFCGAVSTIEQSIHKAAPKANVYLYETWAPADTTYEDSSDSSFSAAAFPGAQQQLINAYHNVYLSAATHDGNIAGTAPVGDAWALAWSEGIANPDPYAGSAPGAPLSFGYQMGSEPTTIDKPTDAGYHHPSIYGAYLSGLVLFQKITGIDVRTLGANEKAAVALGIPLAVATQLQQVAWESVTQQSSIPINQTVDPCTLTH